MGELRKSSQPIQPADSRKAAKSRTNFHADATIPDAANQPTLKIMKTKILPVLFGLAVVFAANQASAYYNPSTGRWLSRDPNGEPGFELLRSASAVPGVGQVATSAALPPSRIFARDVIETKKEPNRYDFVANNPVKAVDYIGLATLSLQEVVNLSGDNQPAGIRDDITVCVMVALLWKESSFNTTAETSPPNTAKGIAQINDGTADDIQDRVAKNYGGSDPFYTLPKGERLLDNRFDPAVSIFAAYIYLDDRYRATGTLAGALSGYGPNGATTLNSAKCLCSQCGGFYIDPKTGKYQIKNETSAWSCLYKIHN